MLSNNQAGRGRNFSQPRAHRLVHLCTYSVPFLKGVGYSALTMVFLENVYYIIIVAWTLYYIMNTFFTLGSGLPWSDCEKGG